MIWDREQYIRLMTGEDVKRQLFVELFGPLVGLEDEWRAQGASQDEIDLTAFCFDSVNKYYLGHTGMLSPPENEIIREDDDVLIYRDYLGRTCKMIKFSSTIPLPLDYPVKNMEDWLKLKPQFMFHESRVDYNEIKKAKKSQEQGTLVLAGMPGGFNFPRELMGDEEACISYYDNPELMRDIVDTISETSYRVLDRISSEITIDNLTVHEDMAGKTGPLVGPDIIDEFIAPYYKKNWDLLSSRGTKLFSQDSDGNMNPVLDSFISAGVNIFYPMEPAASMDIVESRKKYGKKIAYKGGIDKHVLRGSANDIKKELEYKLQPCMRAGGTVFALDHRIPNGTPFENYKCYIKTAREMLGLEPVENAEKGWTRMAF